MFEKLNKLPDHPTTHSKTFRISKKEREEIENKQRKEDIMQLERKLAGSKKKIKRIEDSQTAIEKNLVDTCSNDKQKTNMYARIL